MPHDPGLKPDGLAGAQATKAVGLVNYQDGAVVSRELVKKPSGTVTVFAFDQGQGLSEHTARFNALLQVLEGEAMVVISGHHHCLRAGGLILIPANEPHSVKAIKRFKMILTMLRS